MKDVLRRRALAVVATAVVLTGILAVASDAGHETSPVSVTGCLKTSNGTLTRLAVGDSPLSPCPSGNVTVHMSGGDLTSVTAGTGLSGGGTGGAVTLDVDFADFGSCAAGSAIRVNGGTATCEADDDTTYTAGSGLTLTGTTFAADTAVVQARVSGFCSVGSSIKTINVDGSVVCEADDNTTYSAGTGLDLTGTTFDVDFGDFGACPPGSAIRVVNSAEVTATCEPIPQSSPVNETLLIQRHEFDADSAYFNLDTPGAPGPREWEVLVTGAGEVIVDEDYPGHPSTSALTLHTNCCDSSAVVHGNRQASAEDGTLIFKAHVLDAYAEAGFVYGNAQPRGLRNGADADNAIEFLNTTEFNVSGHNTGTKCRTASGGSATETPVDIGQWTRRPAYYQIVATATEARFYVNGVLECTHTTNIPIAPLNLFFGTSTNTGNIPLVVDWASLELRPS